MIITIQELHAKGEALSQGMCIYWHGPHGKRRGKIMSEVRGDNHHPQDTHLNIDVLPDGESQVWIKSTEIIEVDYVKPYGIIKRAINRLI